MLAQRAQDRSALLISGGGCGSPHGEKQPLAVDGSDFGGSILQPSLDH